jgi:hypothetical protein
MKICQKFLLHLFLPIMMLELIVNFCVYAKSSDSVDLVQYDKVDLETLFNSQIQNLKDRGCPEEILICLQNQHSKVISKAQHMSFARDNIPFIPVIPQSVWDLKKIMNMVQVVNSNGKIKKGSIRLKISSLKDIINVPIIPYYIYDVSKGGDLRGKSPENAERIIVWEGVRRCLTVDETIALCVHTRTLYDFNLWAAGSRYSADFIPCVWHMHINGPMLSWNPKDSYDDFWGTPSCLK